jgi:hypothetical protein
MQSDVTAKRTKDTKFGPYVRMQAIFLFTKQ